MHPIVLAELRRLALGVERPLMKNVQARLNQLSRAEGLRPPARATLYNTLPRLSGHTYSISKLPAIVRQSLYNLAPDAVVPGHQLAFHCFNHGSLAAVCFGSGLPWIDLYQASRLRGWRPKSRGLLVAAMGVRGIA
jgi:hypothetical protein